MYYSIVTAVNTLIDIQSRGGMWKLFRLILPDPFNWYSVTIEEKQEETVCSQIEQRQLRMQRLLLNGMGTVSILQNLIMHQEFHYHNRLLKRENKSW